VLGAWTCGDRRAAAAPDDAVAPVEAVTGLVEAVVVALGSACDVRAIAPISVITNEAHTPTTTALAVVATDGRRRRLPGRGDPPQDPVVRGSSMACSSSGGLDRTYAVQAHVVDEVRIR
jgi:hypothetical protein